MHAWPRFGIWRPCQHQLHRHLQRHRFPVIPLEGRSQLLFRSYSLTQGPSPPDPPSPPLPVEDPLSDPSEKQRETRDGRQKGGLFTTPPPPRIHIVGLAKIGCLVAHALRSIHPKRPVTLITHRASIAQKFRAQGGLITVERRGLTLSRTGFDVEISHMALENLLPYAARPQAPSEGEAIDHLIVTTQGPYVKQAVGSLVKRLSPGATIAFIHNGMGVVEEINSLYFPNPQGRPNYIVGVITHGVSTPTEPVFEPFYVLLNRVGSLKLGIALPTEEASPDYTTAPALKSLPPTTSYLLNSLLSAEDLIATYLSPQEIIALQAERLAINAIINPLTVVFDCLNGALLHNLNATKVIKLLLWETSQVIRALPGLQQFPTKDFRFSEESLYNLVVKVARRTQESTSTMLNDLRRGIPTEIDYMNGWVVQKGVEFGTPCTMNFMVQNMVKAKERMARMERERGLPFENLEQNFQQL